MLFFKGLYCFNDLRNNVFKLVIVNVSQLFQLKPKVSSCFWPFHNDGIWYVVVLLIHDLQMVVAPRAEETMGTAFVWVPFTNSGKFRGRPAPEIIRSAPSSPQFYQSFILRYCHEYVHTNDALGRKLSRFSYFFPERFNVAFSNVWTPFRIAKRKMQTGYDSDTASISHSEANPTWIFQHPYRPELWALLLLDLLF